MIIIMRRNEWRKERSFSSFLFLLSTLFFLLSQFADPVIAASQTSSSSASPRRVLVHNRSERLKKSSSLVSSSSPRRREWKTVVAAATALNSSRNARQVPEIPALYSAPDVIKTPDLPALYSAPGQLEDTQNEVELGADQQGRATTEITIGDDTDEEEETSSEDIQYGVPTEKYPMSDDPNQNEEESPNDYPTDSPLPQATYLPPMSRTNDVEFDDGNADDETTEDSYRSPGGYSNNEPSPQYGPPQAEPSPQYGPPQANNRKNGNGGGGNGAKKRKMQSSPASSSRARNGNGNNNANSNGRAPDQQQIENSLQPMTRHQEDVGKDSNPESAYLPPVYQPPQQEPQASPPQYDDQEQKDPPQQRQQQDTFSNGYSSNEGYAQQPPNPNYHTLPQQQQEQDAGSQRQEHPLQDLSQEGRSPQQSQGQYFGNSNHRNQQQEQPSSFYGPPGGVNHFDHQRQPSNGNSAEEELEGLNEKIVDAELFERVQQIIEDHERQQKELLDKIQKDNEKALFSSPGASGVSSSFAGNELNSGGGGNNEGNNDFSPYPYYGPPSAPSSNNGYPNPNSAQPAGAYLPPSSLSSQPNGGASAGGYTNSQPSQPQQGEKDRESSTRKLSADVEVQKAVLSRHFTETGPDPASSPYNNYKNDRGNGYSGNTQLNSVAGPGQEYLPPASSSSSSAQGQQEQSRNSQNSGYSNSFQSGGGGGKAGDDRENGYSVKVGAGITVANDDGGPRSTSGGSSSIQYGAPALSSQNTREFNARQDGGSSSPRALERFPSQLHQYQAPSQQQQQQSFPSSEFWSRTNPQHTSPTGPQTRYGPPTPTFLSNTAASNGGGSSNNINNGQSGTKQDGVSPFQIKYSNGASDNAVVNSNPASGSSGEYNQRSPHQYLPPGPPQPSSNIYDNPVMVVSVPRPVYGIPLAPVITLDSDNNLHNFNNNNNPGYSPDATKAGGPSFPITGSTSSGPTSNYYLPPPSSSSSQQQGGIGQYQDQQDRAALLNSLNLPESPRATPSNANHYEAGGAGSYGLPPNNNNPSSSSSAYLMVQGQNGNSNNHIYNINHNGYDDTSSGSSSIIFTRLQQQQAPSSSNSLNQDDYDEASSSIMIPGISNTFSLPLYDYSPSHQQLHHEELLGSATAPVVLPFQQLLQHQLPPNIPALTLPSSSTADFPDNFPALFYDGAARRQDNFRVSRRALSRKASISPASNRNSDNFNQKQPKQQPLNTRTTTATTTVTNSNNKRTSRQGSRST